MFCRIEVPPGSSLLLRYKGPWPFGSSAQAPEGTLVQTDAAGGPLQVGILEAMPGPGRHFYSPLEYETQLVKDEVIPPGKLGVWSPRSASRCPRGPTWSTSQGYRGILRKVLTPGRYRINTYAFDVKIVDVDACVEPNTRVKRKADDPTLIPPGYVGVVTNKASDPSPGEDRGIQKQVLQPGIYFLNPEEKRIDIVSIGYSETSLMVEARRRRSRRPRRRHARSALAAIDRGDRLGTSTADDPIYAPGKGIEFPSNDGFPIHLDYTAIWGILPEQAPDVVRQFGTLKDVEQKVILPQIDSICRLHGSRRGAVDLLVGDTREQFQNETSAELERVLTSKNLSLLFGLTRHIYVPKAVREPIQKAKIADELTKTREQEQLTAKAQADLTEAKAKVVFEEKRTQAETEKMVAEVGAEGEKKAKEIEAMTEKLKAEIDAKTRDHRGPVDQGARRGQGQVGQAGQGGQGRAAPATGQGDGRARLVRALRLRRRPARRPASGHLLRRPGHPLDRPERVRADDARQARLRGTRSRFEREANDQAGGRGRGGLRAWLGKWSLMIVAVVSMGLVFG